MALATKRGNSCFAHRHLLLNHTLALQNLFKNQCVFSITNIFVAAFINGQMITYPQHGRVGSKKRFYRNLHSGFSI